MESAATSNIHEQHQQKHHHHHHRHHHYHYRHLQAIHSSVHRVATLEIAASQAAAAGAADQLLRAACLRHPNSGSIRPAVAGSGALEAELSLASAILALSGANRSTEWMGRPAALLPILFLLFSLPSSFFSRTPYRKIISLPSSLQVRSEAIANCSPATQSLHPLFASSRMSS